MKYMSKWTGIFLLSLALLPCASCSDDQTYAEQKEDERKAINAFIGRVTEICSREGDTIVHVDPITVISEQQFLNQDSTTNLSLNEYVLFNNSGVYMQIVRKGVGGKLESGQRKKVLARYVEFNIMSDSILTRNDALYYSTTPDIIDISNSYGTFTASFNTDNGGGSMYRTYRSAEVPAGWLVPFSYVHLGRQVNEDDAIAKVRLIVPHSKGTSQARQAVYPTFYEITFQETRE